ncbi:hypothetical protein [Flavobacterium pallidum]|nr:hypothetical protein [Flavobacterium pallidum]
MYNDETPRVAAGKGKMAFIRKAGFYALIATLIVYYVLAINVIFMS